MARDLETLAAKNSQPERSILALLPSKEFKRSRELGSVELGSVTDSAAEPSEPSEARVATKARSAT